jgi:cytosine deaminase
MCAGTSVLYEIPRIVIGENESFQASEAWLRSMGTQVDVVGDATCRSLMQRMIADRPQIWFEDIGEEG